MSTDLAEYLKKVDLAHDQTQRGTRQEYISLLTALMPPRTGPAPAPDAHELAGPPPSTLPSPDRVLALLQVTGKTRDDMARDVATLTTVRDQADLVASEQEVEASWKARYEQKEAADQAFKALQAEWIAKINSLRLAESVAYSRRSAVDAARTALLKAQALYQEHEAIRGPDIFVRATPEQLVAQDAARAGRAAVASRATRLLELEVVFFPPPPPPARDPNMTYIESPSICYYHPRADRS